MGLQGKKIMLQKRVRAGFVQAAFLTAIGLVVGGVAGWLETAAGGSVSDAAALGAKVFLALVVLLPIGLVLLNLEPQDPSLYSSFGGALVVLLLGGLAGAILASAVFLVPATNIPTIFAGKNPAELSLTLQAEVGRGTFLLVVGITTTVAIVLALWNFVRIRNYYLHHNSGS